MCHSGCCRYATQPSAQGSLGQSNPTHRLLSHYAGLPVHEVPCLTLLQCLVEGSSAWHTDWCCTHTLSNHQLHSPVGWWCMSYGAADTTSLPLTQPVVLDVVPYELAARMAFECHGAHCTSPKADLPGKQDLQRNVCCIPEARCPHPKHIAEYTYTRHARPYSSPCHRSGRHKGQPKTQRPSRPLLSTTQQGCGDMCSAHLTCQARHNIQGHGLSSGCVSACQFC